MPDFDLAKNRTAHAQTHYRKSTQWQWASFVSDTRNMVVIAAFNLLVHIILSLAYYNQNIPQTGAKAGKSCLMRTLFHCFKHTVIIYHVY